MNSKAHPARRAARLSTQRRRTRCLQLLLAAGCALLANAPIAAADPLDLGSGAQPSVALDASGNAYIAYNDLAATGQAIHLCKLARGAGVCTPVATLTPGGSTIVRPYVFVDRLATVRVLTSRYGFASGPYLQDMLYSSADGFASPVSAGTVEASGGAIPGPGAQLSVVNANAATVTYQALPTDGTTAGEMRAGLSTTYQNGTDVGLIDPSTPLVTFADATTTAFSSYSGTGDPNSSTSWSAARPLATGVDSHLAGGPSGLFDMLAESGDHLVVRRYDSHAATFGAPTAVPGGTGRLNNSFLYQDGAGELHAVWERAIPGTSQLMYSTSGDGVSWTSPAVLASDDAFGEVRAAAASDHVGLAVWTSGSGSAQRIHATPLAPAVPGSPTPPTPPAPPAPPATIIENAQPTAHFVSTRSTTLSHATSFNAAGTVVPAGDTIIRYEWSFGDDKRLTDARCGAGLPITSHPFGTPGTHVVSLRVTDARGQTATTSETISVDRASVNPGRQAADLSDCENPAAGNRPDQPGCVKSISFGLVDVGSRGGPSDCFTIENYVPGRRGPALRRDRARAAAPLLCACFAYHARIDGPVALNGLYLPIPAHARSEYDSRDSTIDIPAVSVYFGRYRTKVAPLTRVSVTPDRSGRYHLLDLPLSAPFKLFGLRVEATVGFDLIRHASLTTLHVGLPAVFTLGDGHQAQANAVLYSDNLSGLSLDGVSIQTGSVLLGPVTLNGLYFNYNKSSGLLEGGASLSLPGALVRIEGRPPPPDFGFGLRNGQFDHAGAGVYLQNAARPQLFPGVFLTHLGVSIGVNPTRFTGLAGISVANVIDVDGAVFAAFPSARAPYDYPSTNTGDELSFLAGRRLTSTTVAVGGTGSLEVPVLGPIKAFSAHVLYTFPDYFEVGGNFEFGVSATKGGSDLFTVRGGFDGFALPSSKLFNFQLGAEACIHFIIDGCAPKAGGVISNKGIAFCGYFPLVIGPYHTVIPGGLGYRWGDTLPKVMLFGCDYGPYVQASPMAARASGQGRTVRLATGLAKAMIEVKGRDGAPRITLVGPNGERVSSPRGGGNAAGSGYLVLADDKARTTVIALQRPSGGRWTLTAMPGSPAVVGLATAAGLPDLNLHARVSGRTARRTVTYSFNAAPGRTVQFAERGARTYRILGRVSRSGRLQFVPAAGAAGRRTIEAQVAQDGVPTGVRIAAEYPAPAPPSPGRPRRIRVTRRGAALIVTWAAQPGVAGYDVIAQLSDGERTMLSARRPGASFRNVRASLAGTIVIVALRPDGTPGPHGEAAIPRPAPRRRRSSRSSSGRHA